LQKRGTSEPLCAFLCPPYYYCCTVCSYLSWCCRI
jgi:hypothetical protein